MRIILMSNMTEHIVNLDLHIDNYQFTMLN